MPKEAIHNNMNNYRAGILTAGEARARSIPAAVCDERATKPAVKRPSESVHVIVNGLLSFGHSPLTRLAGCCERMASCSCIKGEAISFTGANCRAGTRQRFLSPIGARFRWVP